MRAGATLVELLVALVILGITGGVVLVSWPRNTSSTAESSTLGAIAADARRVAITTGRPQRVLVRLTREGTLLDSALPESEGQLHSILALPDGGIIASKELLIDRLSGRLVERPRTP